MSSTDTNLLHDPAPPTEPFEFTNGLSLIPRIRLRLTIHRADNTVAALDEWKLKRSLVEFLKSTSNFFYTITVLEEDIIIRRYKDLKKRKRDDPVARGVLLIRDLGFVKESAKRELKNGEEEEIRVLERKFKESRKTLVDKMDGMEVNLEGVKFKLSVEVPIADDFDRLKKEWEEFYAFGDTRGYSRGAKHEPDTIILRGVPSRWFAEPRVSSKPSMLVTHTIFSTIGKIRNLNVAEDNDLGEDADEDGKIIIPGLHCKIMVQFERHKDFQNCLKLLCSRSLQKDGSRMKADYEVSWDRDEFFENRRSYARERDRRMSAAGSERYRYDDTRRQSYHSRYSPEYSRSKRFKE